MFSRTKGYEPRLPPSFYGPICAIVHLVIILIIQITAWIPAWVFTYVPILMAYPFYATAMMIGFHALACSHFHLSTLLFHLFSSVISVIFLGIFLNEWFLKVADDSIPDNTEGIIARFNGTSPYSMLARPQNSLLIRTYVPTNGNISTFWWNFSMGTCFALLGLSFVHFVFACIGLTRIPVSSHDRFLWGCCGGVIPERCFVSIVALISVCINCSSIAFSIIMLTNSIILLNPVSNSNLLFVYASTAALYLPQASISRCRWKRTLMPRVHDIFSKTHQRGPLSEASLGLFGIWSLTKKILVGALAFCFLLVSVLSIFDIAGQSGLVNGNPCANPNFVPNIANGWGFNYTSSHSFTRISFLPLHNNNPLNATQFASWTCVDFAINWTILFLSLLLFIGTILYMRYISGDFLQRELRVGGKWNLKAVEPRGNSYFGREIFEAIQSEIKGVV